MANTILADNISYKNTKDRVYLTANVAAGATTIDVGNATNIAVGDILYLSAFGEQRCERSVVASVSGNTVTLGSILLSDHKKGELVTDVFGDQIQFLAAPNVDGTAPAVGSFASIANVDLDTNDVITVYVDTDGSVETDPTARWYAYVYRNSITMATTDVNDIVPARGGDYGHYCSLDDIRSEAGFKNNEKILDSEIDMYRTDAEEEVNAMLSKITTVPFTAPLPRMVPTITRRLAAGYLMLKEYGPPSDTNAAGKDGSTKVKWAQNILTQMQAGNMPLLDATGNTLTNGAGFSSYPDDSTLNGDGVAAPYFTMDRHF